VPEPDEGDEVIVSQALAAVIRDHGWRIVTEPQRLRASLSDVLGAHADGCKGWVDALAISAEEGVPAKVREVGRSGLPEVDDSLVAALQEWGLAGDRARWTIDAWAGLVPDRTDLPPDTTPLPPPPRPRPSDRVDAPTELPGEPPASVESASVPSGSVPPEVEPPEPRRHGRRRWYVAAAAFVVLAGTGAAVAVIRDGDDGMPAGGDDRRAMPGGHSTSPATGQPLTAGRVVSAPEARPHRASGASVMAGRSGGVRLTAFGPVRSVGDGPSASLAPPGGSLVAFSLDGWCPTDHCTRWRALPLEVAVGSTKHRLPSGGDTFVVAVPRGEKKVALVLDGDGHDQRLSLTTGRAVGDNILVLTRKLGLQTTTGSADSVASTSLSFSYPWGRSSSARRHARVTSAQLRYFAPGLTPKDADSALLFVEAYYDYSAYGYSQHYGFGREEVRFQPAGEKLLVPLADPRPGAAGTSVYVFEVPGSMTRGSFVIGAHGIDRTTSQASGTVPAGTHYTLSLSTARIPLRVS
jgi:hypothetical protein